MLHYRHASSTTFFASSELEWRNYDGQWSDAVQVAIQEKSTRQTQIASIGTEITIDYPPERITHKDFSVIPLSAPSGWYKYSRAGREIAGSFVVYIPFPKIFNNGERFTAVVSFFVKRGGASAGNIPTTGWSSYIETPPGVKDLAQTFVQLDATAYHFQGLTFITGTSSRTIKYLIHHLETAWQPQIPETRADIAYNTIFTAVAAIMTAQTRIVGSPSIDFNSITTLGYKKTGLTGSVLELASVFHRLVTNPRLSCEEPKTALSGGWLLL
nr:hypothetical protein [Leuven wasp-associated virus 4]